MPIVTPRTENQRRYVELMDKHSLVFGVGPAGTGKTYLAVVMAIQALRSGRCKRLVITRPVVEAGERLGFLPGDVQAKLNPYMRPIYDALFDLLDFEEVQRLEETGVIEVAPLAFMRGRTLAHSFAILDEGQNTSIAQMKMFLTRLGEGSRMVVTGDPTQNDLEGGVKSGLLDALARFRGFDGIGLLEFGLQDIVRHPLVERIVRAYEGPARERGPEGPDRTERPDRGERFDRTDRGDRGEDDDRPDRGGPPDRTHRPGRGGRR
ncbi:MAG: PhoH family protein [Planctomycetes bacterium]|nr:PhoH family protein [Planctomycetota bacterium]